MKLPSMINKGIEPLYSTKVNGKYIIAIYQGQISEFDILIKYRQFENEKWSRIRTPKHIHWTVDMLIKLYQDENTTQEFLDRLISLWTETKGIKTKTEFDNIDIEKLYEEHKSDIEKFKR